ncbi:putative DNA repair protein YkoV [compost metagenome]
MRNVEHLAIVKPYKGSLLLNKIRYEQEIRAIDELKLPGNIKIKKEEMDMALQLIKQHSKSFDISKYKNEYTQDLLKIIQQKDKGKRASIRKIKVDNTKASDLLAKLKASLA